MEHEIIGQISALSRKEPALEHHHAHLGDVRLHYVEAGSGPLVVLLHGFPEFWYSWRFQIPILARAGFRVVAPDMRGYNLSDKPSKVGDYRVEFLARDVERLIRACGAESAAVVGHDWGGVAGWLAAMRHPEAVKKLAILNCPHPNRFLRGLWSPHQLRKSWYMFALQVPVPPGRFVQEGIFSWFKSNFRRDPVRQGTFSEEDIRRYVEAMGRPGVLTATTNYYRALFRRSPAQNKKLLRRVEAPVVVIWGEEDRYLGRELAEPEASWVPNVRVERLPEASHWVQQDSFHRVNALLLEFLRAPLESSGAGNVNTSMSETRIGLAFDDLPARGSEEPRLGPYSGPAGTEGEAPARPGTIEPNILVSKRC
jgi:epoxide hydrolase 4